MLYCTCPAMTRDVLDIKDGKIESYVCIGFNQGAQVTCLAFQPSGTLLVSQYSTNVS